MNVFEAIMIIEGYEESDEVQIIEAYQHLLDTGIINHLQGAYGRNAMRLLEEGYLTLRPQELQ